MCRAMCRKNKFCFKDAKMLAAEFYEANFFQKIKLIFVSDTKDMKKVYESVKIAVNECCLNDAEQLEEIDMVRAFYNGDTGARAIGTSLNTGLIGMMVALFGVECSLIIGLISLYQTSFCKDLGSMIDVMQTVAFVIGALSFIMILLIPLGAFQILYSSYRQKRSSVIVSAIDDTLKNAKRIKEAEVRVCEHQNEELTLPDKSPTQLQ